MLYRRGVQQSVATSPTGDATRASALPAAPGLSRMPGLDGLRGLAVLAVLLFHNDFAWARGGYLGVSLFFTLSGFLIASLLLVEATASGRINLLAFWGRRIRRLAPAALVTLLLVCMYAAWVASPSQLLGLRDDAWSALGNVMNWRLLASGHSYAALFNDPSPVQHFWSLAIEEQFYLVFPPIAVLVTMVAGRGAIEGRGLRIRRVLGATVGALALGSIAAQLATGTVDRVYYGTDTRAFEIVAGVLLACWLAGRPLPRPTARVAAAVGVVALPCMVFLWSQLDFTTAWLYRGGFGAIAVLNVVVIMAAIAAGPVRALCSWRALRAVGLVSYGLYLYHWPIYLWLDPARTGLTGWPLFALRMAVTSTLAIASYFLLERPIRRGTFVSFKLAPAAWLAGLATVALVVPLAVATPDSASVITQGDFERADRIVASLRSDPPPVPSSTPGASDAGIPVPLKVYVVGDSTGVVFAGALGLLARDTGVVDVRSNAAPGCAFTDNDRVQWLGQVVTVPPMCSTIQNLWSSALAQWKPDVILVVSGATSAQTFHLAGQPDDSWSSIQSASGRALIAQGMTATSDALERAAPGVPQLWLTSPYLLRSKAASGQSIAGTEAVPARADLYNALIGSLAKRHTGVTPVPWGDYFNNLSLSADAEVRPDGIHGEPEVLERVLRDWGWARIIDAYRAVS
jgi:peptidoglycan/LPS O-acetylase OafA/YrhL